MQAGALQAGQAVPQGEQARAAARHTARSSPAPQAQAQAGTSRPAAGMQGRRSSSRGGGVACAAAAAAAAPPAGGPTLSSIPLQPVLNVNGLIQPDVPETTQASIFAIYDDQRALQFVGFSKDVRNSLRAVFSRRPEKCFFFKAIHFPTLDQAGLGAAQKQWFAEEGGPPPGNKLELERRSWSQPVNAGALSARGQRQAAESKTAEMLTLIRSRGCKENFLPDPAKLDEGLVEFLPSKALTPEEQAALREQLEALERAKRRVSGDYLGETIAFDLFFKDSIQTNGGMMFDLTVTYDELETTHRVIVGKPYYEGAALTPEEVLEKTFLFLLGRRVPRQTEGLLGMEEFPINYFSMSTVDQHYDDFRPWWEASLGAAFPSEQAFWRFNRLHDYANKGNSAENLDGLSMSLDRIGRLESGEGQTPDWSMWAPLAK